MFLFIQTVIIENIMGCVAVVIEFASPCLVGIMLSILQVYMH